MALDDFANMYTDWVNNFLTVKRFAEYYEIRVEDAQRIIDLGREIEKIDLEKTVY